LVRSKTDSLRSTKEKEVINKFAENHPRQVAKLANKKFRKELVKNADLSKTDVAKADQSLTNSIKKVDSKFDPHKFTKIGAATGAVTGTGAIATLGAINPALAATPGVGPGSMTAYGTAIGSAIDRSRIKKLSKNHSGIRRTQNKLTNLKKSTNLTYKSLTKRAVELKRAQLRRQKQARKQNKRRKK